MTAAKMKTIDGLNFWVEPVGAWDSYGLFHQLVTLFGPMLSIISTAIDGASKAKSGEKVDMLSLVKLDQLAAELPQFLARATPAQMKDLCQTMFAKSTYQPLQVRGGPKQEEPFPLMPLFDTLLAGKLLTVFKLIIFGIEVNFSDFWSGARLAIAAKARADAVAAQANSKSSPPPVETPAA